MIDLCLNSVDAVGRARGSVRRQAASRSRACAAPGRVARVLAAASAAPPERRDTTCWWRGASLPATKYTGFIKKKVMLKFRGHSGAGAVCDGCGFNSWIHLETNKFNHFFNLI